MKRSRREFLNTSTQYVIAGTLFSPLWGACSEESSNSEKDLSKESNEMEISKDLFFKISLAQWSLNKAFFAGAIDHLDFARIAKNEYGIEAVEYVNQFFKDKANDKEYLNEMNKRAGDLGVKQLLIMVDGEGGLAELDDIARKTAVENHYKWVEAAKHLGCHSIRVNAYGVGSSEEVSAAAVQGLGQLATFAKDYDLNVIVENHGGYSSNGQWLSNVMAQIGMENCGTLPDFGNFCIESDTNGNCVEEYDRYRGVEELMKYAKAVSAKSHDFDANGNEIHSDYMRILKIVKDAGYTGYVGIEYEGSEMLPEDGIRATKALLEKVGATL